MTVKSCPSGDCRTNPCSACPTNYPDPKATQGGRLDVMLGSHGPDNLPVVYISGPMSGYPGFNFKAFNDTARKLRLFGFPVLNPADFGASTEHNYAHCISRDLHLVYHADVICLLPDWELSRGAGIEFDCANLYGKPILELADFVRKVVTAYFSPKQVAAVIELDKYREEIVALIKEDGIQIARPATPDELAGAVIDALLDDAVIDALLDEEAALDSVTTFAFSEFDNKEGENDAA